jgi:osmotically-inducible protein OsmY
MLKMMMVIAVAIFAAAPQRQSESKLSDSWITTQIYAKYFLDREIKARTITVDTARGVVTLHGEVRSESERDRAVGIARSIDGVSRVIDRLEVKSETGTSGRAAGADRARRSDDDKPGNPVNDVWITTRIQSKYFLDADVKGRDIDVTTENGVVTLKGEVRSQTERRQAVRLARETTGVRDVVDRLMVRAHTSDGRGQTIPGGDEISKVTQSDPVILTQIKTKFAVDPDVSAFAIDVDVDDGVVTLTGTVKNEQARQRALALARSVQGVKRVSDNLTVRP